jgi:hypothetical protein
MLEFNKWLSSRSVCIRGNPQYHRDIDGDRSKTVAITSVMEKAISNTRFKFKTVNTYLLIVFDL